MDFVEVVTEDKRKYRVDSLDFQKKNTKFSTGYHLLDLRGVIENKGRQLNFFQQIVC